MNTWHSQWIDEHQLVVMHWHAQPPVRKRFFVGGSALPPDYGDIFVEDFKIGVLGGAAILRRDSCIVPTKMWHLGDKLRGDARFNNGSFALTTRDVNLPGIPIHAASCFWLCDTPQGALRLLRKLTAGVPPGKEVCVDKSTEVDVGRGHKHHVDHRIVGRPPWLACTPQATFRWRDEIDDLHADATPHYPRIEPLDEEDRSDLWFADVAREVERLIAADDDYRRAEWRLHLRAMIDCDLPAKR
jgi:hypothetical protein